MMKPRGRDPNIALPGATGVDSVQPLTILAVATEWESHHGGVSTFNRELCTALGALGHRVFCLVPSSLPGEYESAAAVGVTILVASEDPGLSDEVRLCSHHSLPADVVPDVVIGHGRVTGPAAKVLSRHFETSLRVHFIHVAPGAIEWFKDHAGQSTDRAEAREQLEIALATSAALLAAVGPLLLREFEILLSGVRHDLHEFRPGLSKRRETPAFVSGMQCLVLGRAEDEQLKGVDIAARAVALLERERAPRPILMIRGAPPGTGDDLRKRMLEIAGRRGVDIRIRPFSADSRRIADDIAQSSVVLMPSRSDGFGLVGLEGISAGVPVLLSDRSGLAELLFNLVPDIAECHVVAVTGDIEIDGPVWARRIDAILRDRETAVSRVRTLRERLKPILSWERSAAALLAALPSPSTARRDLKQSNLLTLPIVERRQTAVADMVGETRVADIATVRSWGWDDLRLQRELYDLDYETMDGLSDDHSGLIEQWGPVFSEHPESWRLIYAEPGKILGYWHFVTLFEGQYEQARTGHLLDRWIAAENLRSFELPGIYNIYFAGVCLRPEMRRPRSVRILIHSLLEVILSLAQENVFVGEICANAFTPGGIALCKSLGMNHCAKHSDHGEIFAGRLVDMLDLKVADCFPQLRSLYRSTERRRVPGEPA